MHDLSDPLDFNGAQQPASFGVRTHLSIPRGADSPMCTSRLTSAPFFKSSCKAGHLNRNPTTWLRSGSCPAINTLSVCSSRISFHTRCGVLDGASVLVV